MSFDSCRGLAIRSERVATAGGLADPKGRVFAKPAWLRFCGVSQNWPAASAFGGSTAAGSRSLGLDVSIAATATTIGILLIQPYFGGCASGQEKSHNKPLQFVVALVGLRRSAHGA